MTWKRAVRRLGSAVAATALTVPAALAVAAVPATAQSDPVSLDVFFADVAVPAGGSSQQSVVIDTSRDASLDEFQLTFELSGLAGVATAAAASGIVDCTTTGTQLVCDTLFPVDVLQGGGLALFDLALTAAGPAGATGTLTVTAEAAGVAAASHESTVTVGNAVDLAGDDRQEVTTAPGDTFSLSGTVSNAGPAAAQGAALQVFKDFVLRPQERYRNCLYFDSGAGSVLCTFDLVLEPGTTYAFATPFGIEVGDDALAPAFFAVEGRWMTRTEGAAWQAELGHAGQTGTPGTGPTLTLVEEGGGAPAPLPADPVPAADLDPGNNGFAVDVTVAGDNQADLAAVGAELAGAAGDTVTAEVGVENLGPATADASRAGEPVDLVLVTVPDGTTAVEVPGSCGLVDADGYDFASGGQPGAPAYICATDPLLPAGEAELFTFVLRIDEVIEDATGTVEVNQPAAVTVDPPTDPNPDNDAAEIVVNPTSGGGGGGLPITGAATGMVAAAGALLVALGGAALLLARRRRTRFVA